jgi:hypothetical protein
MNRFEVCNFSLSENKYSWMKKYLTICKCFCFHINIFGLSSIKDQEWIVSENMDDKIDGSF